MKKCAVLSVGQEILFGHTLDTNASFFCNEMRLLGIEVAEMRTVNDEFVDIVKAITELAEVADFILVSGGLGPTPDDLTRQAIAEAAGVELVLKPELLEQIEKYFATINRKMGESNKVQAMLPETATALPNNCGTAPGVRCAVGSAVVFAMPGVPSEMKVMFAESVKPELLAESGNVEYYLKRIHLSGMGESYVGDYLKELQKAYPDLEIGTTVDHYIVTVRVSGVDTAKAEEAAALVREAFKDFVFGEDGVTLEEAIVGYLQSKGMTLALAESCTGGIIASKIVGVSGASKVLLEGIVSYSNESKIRTLGVDPEIIAEYGAVSARCAKAMAEGARSKAGADYALSVTGIAGPDGGTEQKPVGTVFFAVAAPDKTYVFKHVFPQSARNILRIFASHYTMNIMRQIVSGIECYREETPLE